MATLDHTLHQPLLAERSPSSPSVAPSLPSVYSKTHTFAYYFFCTLAAVLAAGAVGALACFCPPAVLALACTAILSSYVAQKMDHFSLLSILNTYGLQKITKEVGPFCTDVQNNAFEAILEDTKEGLLRDPDNRPQNIEEALLNTGKEDLARAFTYATVVVLGKTYESTDDEEVAKQHAEEIHTTLNTLFKDLPEAEKKKKIASYLCALSHGCTGAQSKEIGVPITTSSIENASLLGAVQGSIHPNFRTKVVLLENGDISLETYYANKASFHADPVSLTKITTHMVGKNSTLHHEISILPIPPAFMIKETVASLNNKSSYQNALEEHCTTANPDEAKDEFLRNLGRNYTLTLQENGKALTLTKENAVKTLEEKFGPNSPILPYIYSLFAPTACVGIGEVNTKVVENGYTGSSASLHQVITIDGDQTTICSTATSSITSQEDSTSSIARVKETLTATFVGDNQPTLTGQLEVI